MASKNTIGRRMADFYFEITTPDGKKQVFSSADADQDEEIEEEDEE